MAYAGPATSGPQTSVRLELSVSAKDLKKKDKLSESDPICIIFEKGPQGDLHLLGKTEHLINQKSPSFSKTIPVVYEFERLQPLLIAFYDVDDEKKIDHKKVSKGKDFLGSCECVLGEIVAGRGGAKTMVLTTDSGQEGYCTLKAIESGPGNKSVHFRFSATKVDKKDFFSASDPYYIIKRASSPQDSTWVSIFKSEVIKDDLNPKWKPNSLELGKLCSGNENLPLKIEVFDWDSDGKDDLIGEFTTCLAELRTKKHFNLIEPKIQAKKGSKYTNSGVFNVDNFDLITLHSFLDYVTGGTEVSLVIGIDYTASNGQPNTPQSLHFINPNQPNEYMQAIRSVGDILAPYDNDGKIPVYGFGGFINATKQNLDFFPVNGHNQNPECLGIWGVLQSYMSSFERFQLSGPTNFAPTIRASREFASQARNGERYTVLLMITDGVITDMPATIEEIRKASTVPMSIVIVGVGGADFSKMDVLDNDNNSLKLERDLVQFVPFRKYSNNPVALSREVLKEIPKQLCEHYQKTRIAPRPRPQPSYTPIQPAWQQQGPPQGFAPQGQQGFAPQGQQGFAPQGQQGFAPQGQQGFAPQGQYGPPQGQQGFAPQGQQGFAPQGQYGPPQGQQGPPQGQYGPPQGQ